MLGVVFSQFLAIEVSFQRSESKYKKIFYLQAFFAKFWEFENSQFGRVLD